MKMPTSPIARPIGEKLTVPCNPPIGFSLNVGRQRNRVVWLVQYDSGTQTPMRHVVIIGSNGQLGTDLQPACATSRHAADHAQIDVSDFGKRAVLLL